jgi:colanic acid/amylovoran biosynthesis glycosyltransferase
MAAPYSLCRSSKSPICSTLKSISKLPAARSMRIAYLVNRYPAVSHSFIRREILALERLGFEVKRIALRGWDSVLVDEEDLRERERTSYVVSEGVLTLFIAVLRMLFTRPAALLRALMLAWRMSRGADRPLPLHLICLAEACCIAPWVHDVLHMHAHFGTNSAEVAMLTHVLGGPRWSFTSHGPEEYDRARVIGLTEKIRQCAFVVGISSYGRSQLYRSAEHEHWPKVKVVHCGLEPAFYSVPVNPAPVTQRLVCVGRLCAAKGQLMLVDAAARLAAQGENLEVVLAGDGPMRANIEALIAHYNIQSRVRVTGWISADQVRNEILAARALVLPTFAEGLPVVIMEAMALRRPVISTFVAGIPELVIPGEHGWLVPAGDVDALTQAMKACLDSPADKLAQMGEAARRRVLSRHDVDMEAAKLAKLFKEAAR